MAMPTNTPTLTLIGSTEAAFMLGCSVRTVHRDVSAGKLPYAAKMYGQTGAYLFDRADIERIAAARTSIGALIESAALATITVIPDKLAS